MTDGGGGTFFDIWTPSTFAQAGMLVSNTSTSGRVYQMSSEHHVRHEVQLHGVSNWELHALQTEEERGESGFALPLEIRGLEPHHDLEPPRLPRDQQRPAVPLGGEAHELEGHPLPQRPLLQQQQGGRSTRRCSTTASGVGLRQREFAWLDVSGARAVARRGGTVAGAGAGSHGRAAGGRLPQHLRRRGRLRAATSTSSTRAGSASIAGRRPERRLVDGRGRAARSR